MELKEFKERSTSDIVVYVRSDEDWDVYSTYNHETYKQVNASEIDKYNDAQIDFFQVGCEEPEFDDDAPGDPIDKMIPGNPIDLINVYLK